MRKLAVLLLAFSLGGCATLGPWPASILNNIENVVGVITGATVTPQAVVIAGNSVDALEDTATAYLTLPLCRTGGTPVCRVKVATQPIKRTVLAMRAARDDLETWLRLHPNNAPPATLYEKVTAAITALNNVIAQYHIQPVAVR